MSSDPRWQNASLGCSALWLFYQVPGHILPLLPPQLCHKRKKNQKKRLCLCKPGLFVGEMSPVGTVPVSDLLSTGKGQICCMPAPQQLPACDAKPGRVSRLRAEHCGAEGKLQPVTPRDSPGTPAHPNNPACCTWRCEHQLTSGVQPAPLHGPLPDMPL